MRGSYNFSAKIDKKEPKIYDLVKSDEQIIKTHMPSTTAYVLRKLLLLSPVILIWLLVDVVFIIYIANIASDVAVNAGLVVCMVVFFALHLMPIWLWIWGITQTCSDLRSMEYLLTNKRLIIKNGIKTPNFTIINLKDIEAINYKKRCTDKLLKDGDISINSKYNAIMIYNVYNVNEYLSILMETVLVVNKDVITPDDFKTKKILDK